jgi:CRISPR-associated protein Cmr1
MQDAQWRTPPFKALLRQWWRVAYAAECGFRVDLRSMRHAEGVLFGHAWLEDDCDAAAREVAARRSAVRLRLTSAGTTLESWTRGTQTGVAPLSTDQATSYAWFGLIKRGPGLPDRIAIKASGVEAVRCLQIAVPSEHEAAIRTALELIDAFGAIGSRSRGGWGSLQVTAANALDIAGIARFSRPWTSCLGDDWAMSLAKDERPWIWQSSRTYSQWHEAMQDIALQRRRAREALKSAGMSERSALGFAGTGRMPSPLRWKVVRESSGQLRVRAFAMPHRLPAASGHALRDVDLRKAWSIVRESLDDSQVLKRA